MKEITFDRFVRYLFTIAVCVLLYLLIAKLSKVLTPFFVAWLVAYLLYPIVCFFQYRCKLKFRLLAIFVTLLVVAGLIYLTGMLIVPSFIEEYKRMESIIVEFVQTNDIGGHMAHFFQTYIQPYIDTQKLTELFTITDITSILQERVPQIFQFVSGGIGAIFNLVASLIGIIYLFFILMDYEKLSIGFIRLVPEAQRPFIQGMLNDVEKGMKGYFRGQSVIALCVGIIFAIAFSIIDFPMAIPLGLFMGLLNLVPYLQVLGFIPAIFLSLLKAHETGQGFWIIILTFAIAVFIVQAIQDAILTPKIMGKVMGMNGAIILLSLSIWGSLLGFVGLIIALPLTSLIFSYYKRYILKENPDIEGEIKENENVLMKNEE